MTTNHDSMDLQIEDDNIHVSFARVLKDFRLNFGSQQLKDVASGFKNISYQQLVSIYEEGEMENDNINLEQSEILENWILESKFWSLLEALLEVKFNNNLQQKHDTKIDLDDVSQYSSTSILQDKILSSDTSLLQLHTIIKNLSETFNLDLPNISQNDIDIKDLQSNKWLKTKIDLQSNSRNPKLVKTLDMDAPLRTNSEINEEDQLKDSFFYKKAFKLLLTNNSKELNVLCELSNNWNFALILSGLQDHIDPVIDLDDFSGNSKALGIKHKLLWRRTVYQLASSLHKSNSLSSSCESACYGVLCGDFISSCKLASNWEEKLYLYLNNIFQNEIETKLLQCYQSLELFAEVNMISKLPKPPMSADSINAVLNNLALDENIEIKKESEHSIRVLMGSLISDNVKSLMANTIKSLDNLLTADSTIENELMGKSFLLRILAHLAIILQLIYGEEIINDLDYSKLLKAYILRLILYKSYEQIPTYVSFIPNDNELVEIYSSILYNYEFKHSDRIIQIRSIRQLELPLEAVFRSTVSKAFSETESSYPTQSEVLLTTEVTSVDKKLYTSLYWFYDSGMVSDSIESIIMLLRRFLTVGKLGSSIEFLDTVIVPELIKDYQLKNSINENDEYNEYIVSKYKLSELVQYQHLISAFKKINEFKEDINKISDEVEKLNLVLELSESLHKLLKTWFFELIQDDSIPEQDLELYNELRRIYIPTIFSTLFDMLIGYRNLNNELLVSQAADLVNILADDKYKFYEILSTTNNLKPFLQQFADVSCTLFGETSKGIYV